MKWSRLLITAILISFFLFPGCTDKNTLPTMPFHVFEGTWYQMGKQYGENCSHIGIIYNFYMDEWFKLGFSLDHLKKDINTYTRFTHELEPKLIEFVEGIGEGSKKYFAGSKYEDVLTPFERIMFINAGFEFIWLPGWHAEHEDKQFKQFKQLDDNKPPDKLSNKPSDKVSNTKACTSIACTGKATKEGTTIVGINRDLPIFPFKYQLAYLLKPEEGGKIFGTATEGQVASNFQVNNAPLWVGATRIPGDWDPDLNIRECDFGVPSVIAMLYLSAFCTDVDGAVQKACTVNMTQGMNYFLADDEKIIVVERTSEHYSFRGGQDILVLTNHMLANFSYSVDDHRRMEIPMTKYIHDPNEWGQNASRFSYYSAYYKLRENYGEITHSTWIDKIAGMHSCYDAEGNPVSSYEGKTPLDAGITVECRVKENGELVHATIASHCADLATLDIYFVQGFPSEHPGAMNWQHVNLDEI